MAKLIPSPLTRKAFSQAIPILCDSDPDLARILSILDPPAFWTRQPGFASLMRIILEQQVSLASARATFERLRAAVSPLTPGRFLKLDDATLKSYGFSRQKTAYGRNLANAIVDGQLNLSALEVKDDQTVRSKLLKVKGVGPWSANIYLLTVLRRPDIWPGEDLALAAAVQKLKRLTTRPTPRELEHLSEVWKPWRAVAARLLWHYYIETVSKNRHRGIRSGETPTV